MREERVAFIGISNWALDPAKMNRGVMVTRGDPDVDELVLSARYQQFIMVTSIIIVFIIEEYVLMRKMTQSRKN